MFFALSCTVLTFQIVDKQNVDHVQKSYNCAFQWQISQSIKFVTCTFALTVTASKIFKFQIIENFIMVIVRMSVKVKK